MLAAWASTVSAGEAVSAELGAAVSAALFLLCKVEDGVVAPSNLFTSGVEPREVFLGEFWLAGCFCDDKVHVQYTGDKPCDPCVVVIQVAFQFEKPSRL